MDTPETQVPPAAMIEAITQAIAERLERGYVDGYCYSSDEWRLLKVGVIDRESSLGRIHAYYALVEINTPDPVNSIAVFEVDDGEEAIVIGDDEFYFPDDAVELKV